MCSSHFVEYYDPTIESSYRRQVVIDDHACVLDVLDTAGQEEYSALRSQWIRSGEGFLILYSITDRSSFEEVEAYRTQILQVKDCDGAAAPPIVLVANKCDLANDRAVSTQEGQHLAQQWQCGFFEASAKTKRNVEESFFSVVRQIRAMEKDDRPDEPQIPKGNKLGKSTSFKELKKRFKEDTCVLI